MLHLTRETLGSIEEESKTLQGSTASIGVKPNNSVFLNEHQVNNLVKCVQVLMFFLYLMFI